MGDLRKVYGGNDVWVGFWKGIDKMEKWGEDFLGGGKSMWKGKGVF